MKTRKTDQPGKREAWSVREAANGPQGKFNVSTIRTYMGGAPDETRLGNPFSQKDYADETPWPYETVVFKEIGVTGQYHEAYHTQEEAMAGHARIVADIHLGILRLGHGVTGQWGNPSTTPQEWKNGQLQIHSSE